MKSPIALPLFFGVAALLYAQAPAASGVGRMPYTRSTTTVPASNVSISNGMEPSSRPTGSRWGWGLKFEAWSRPFRAEMCFLQGRLVTSSAYVPG